MVGEVAHVARVRERHRETGGLIVPLPVLVVPTAVLDSFLIFIPFCSSFSNIKINHLNTHLTDKPRLQHNILHYDFL